MEARSQIQSESAVKSKLGIIGHMLGILGSRLGRMLCPLGGGARQALRLSSGLGDVVAKVLRLVGIGKRKQCGGCAARQQALNRIVPFS